MASTWNAGDHVTFRQVWPGGVWAVFPVTVVKDNTEFVSVYMASGTNFLRPDCKRSDYLRGAASGGWELRSDRWIGHHLWTAIPGEACSVWTMWAEEDWRHLGWKVSSEAPLKRTAIGFDTTDYALDATVSLDSGRWTYKDEDEFEEAIELGLIPASGRTSIRADISRICDEALSVRRDQLERWASWRPPSGWGIPSLSPNWNENHPST